MDNMSTAERRIAKSFRPILTAATLGILLAGCSSTGIDTDNDGDEMMNRSVPGAMESSSSVSSDIMIKSSDAMSSEAALNMYKDGSYTADGAYQSPAGGEGVTVSLTVKNDIVTDAMFSGDATHKKSIAMQAAFAEGFKEQVVGKSLDEVSVGVVNGSSLTGEGFMAAVTKIKSEAKAS